MEKNLVLKTKLDALLMVMAMHIISVVLLLYLSNVVATHLYSKLLCHQNPGNWENCHTIGLAASALPLPLPLLYSSNRATWHCQVGNPLYGKLHCIHIEAIVKGGRVIMAGCRRGVAEILPRTTVVIEYKIQIS